MISACFLVCRGGTGDPAWRCEHTAGLTRPGSDQGHVFWDSRLVVPDHCRFALGPVLSGQGWPASDEVQKACSHAWHLLPKTAPEDRKPWTCSQVSSRLHLPWVPKPIPTLRDSRLQDQGSTFAPACTEPPCMWWNQVEPILNCFPKARLAHACKASLACAVGWWLWCGLCLRSAGALSALSCTHLTADVQNVSKPCDRALTGPQDPRP